MDEAKQINVCIDEMAKLKEKMEALEKQKIANEQNETVKKTTMEPNLKVLEDWLMDYYKTNSIVTKNIIDEQNRHIRQQITNKRRNGGVYRSKDFQELSSALKESLSIYEQGLPVTYGTLIGDNYNKISYTTIENKRTKPSEVMKAHIEASYNMFNIINKRLNDIEKKLGNL